MHYDPRFSVVLDRRNMAVDTTSDTHPTRRSAGRRLRAGAAIDKSQRSAVTNGKRLHVIRPGDTAWARRFRDVLAEIISDLASDSLSEGQRQMARRCATIAIACERMEGEAAAGRDIDLDTYGTLTDRTRSGVQPTWVEAASQGCDAGTDASAVIEQ